MSTNYHPSFGIKDMLASMRSDTPDDLDRLAGELLALPKRDREWLIAALLLRLVAGDIDRQRTQDGLLAMLEREMGDLATQ